MKRQKKSISFSFSTDVISEILLRVPEKSVVRFYCVSKLWLSIITDSYFIKLFETRNPRPSRVLICYKEDDKLVVSSIPQQTFSLDQNSIKSYSQPTHIYRMKFPKDYLLSTDSVHGLICSRTSTDVIVWNPNTSKFLTLPKPSKSVSNITTYLGYDAVEVKHKVIVLYSHSICRECRVITLGSGQEETWRIVKTNQKHKPYYNDAYGQCIKGVIYYLASTYQMDQHVWVIMRFDVRSEKLDSIQLPSDIHHVDRLITYEGRLACVMMSGLNSFTLLILEEAEENKWSSKDFLAPFCRYESLQFQLKGFTDTGEFIYGPRPMHKHLGYLYALFFDPVRNSFRRVEFKGRGGYIHMFPNHIDSQMSL